MINCRYLRSGLFAIALALTAGCRESEPAKPLPSLPATPADASRETPYALRLHWIGRERLSAESNATNFMAIWNMPESLRLQNQTLDKLSTAPSRFLLGQTNATNTASTLLRPLLEHIVDHESYLEIHRSTNGPFALALAVRLDAEKARLWESNLPAAMKSLAAVTSVAQSNLQQWALNTRDGIKSVQFTRTGDWVVFGLTASDNGLFNVLQQRLEQNGSLPSELSSGHWLKTEFDLNCLLQPAGFNWKIGGDPAVRMIVTGGGENVRTHAEVKFNRPLNLRFEPWTLPTNMVIEPLSSFTAVRGVDSWLSNLRIWKDLKVGPPPNQWYVWSSPGIPAQVFLAAPHADASNTVRQASDYLARTVNPLLKPGDWGEFEALPETVGAHWVRLPFAAPFVKAFSGDGNAWIVGGSFLPAESASPMPLGLMQAISADTNVFYYDWEITGSKIQTDLYWVQMLRLVSDKSQIADESASGAWLMAMRANLGNAVTQAGQEGPLGLAITRSSVVGFTSLELQVLADWLESPDFPSGLHTFVATNPPPATPAGGN